MFQYVKSGWNAAKDVWNNATSSRDYSDFARKTNEMTDGWFNTAANAIPFVNAAHNAFLAHDEQSDYLKKNGLGWGDVLGYNANKINFGISNNLASLASGGSYLQNVSNDLGKLYSGQTKTPQKTLDEFLS